MAKEKKSTFAIVEDDPFWRSFVVDNLQRTDQWECVAEASSENELLEQLHNCNTPHIVLVDLLLNGHNSLGFLIILRQSLPPSVKLIVVSALDDRNVLLQAIANGASGYLLKQSSPEKLLRELNNLLNDGAPLSPQMARNLIQLYQQENTSVEIPNGLSAKEWQILQRLTEGDSYEGAAVQVRIPVNTLRYYIKKIYKTIGVDNKAAAVGWFLAQKRQH